MRKARHGDKGDLAKIEHAFLFLISCVHEAREAPAHPEDKQNGVTFDSIFAKYCQI
jgi:hypothetical protein